MFTVLRTDDKTGLRCLAVSWEGMRASMCLRSVGPAGHAGMRAPQPMAPLSSPLLPPAQVLGACARTLEGQAGGRPLSPALRDVLLDVVKLYALYRLEQASLFGRRGMIFSQPAECSADIVAHPPTHAPLEGLSWCLC